MTTSNYFQYFNLKTHRERETFPAQSHLGTYKHNQTDITDTIINLESTQLLLFTITTEIIFARQRFHIEIFASMGGQEDLDQFELLGSVSLFMSEDYKHFVICHRG